MKIISFEGIDASGKETQASLLFNYLNNLGFKVAYDSFPRYNKPIGSLLRQYFIGQVDLGKSAVHMLLEADRHDFMAVIEDLESSGYDFLILDRYTMSNLAFGMAQGLNVGWLRDLQKGVRQPDVTFLLDITSETSFKRRLQGRDRYERDIHLLNRTRVAYQFVANMLSVEEDQLIYTIDANHTTPEEIHEVITSHIDVLYLGESYPEAK